MVDSKPLETQGAELPAIIQHIIQAKADELKALIGTDISTLPQLLALIAQETCRAREDLDAYIATYLQHIRPIIQFYKWHQQIAKHMTQCMI